MNNVTIRSGPDPDDCRIQLHSMTKDAGGDPSIILAELRNIVAARLWEDEGMTLREFLEAPLPKGCGVSVERMEQFLKIGHKKQATDPNVAEWMSELRAVFKDEMTAPTTPHGTNRFMKGRPDNIRSINNEYGTSDDYLTARLKRDDPELAEKVIRGEVSAHAAAVQSGIRKKYHQVAHDPDKFAAKILQVFSLEERRAIAMAILEDMEVE